MLDLSDEIAEFRLIAQSSVNMKIDQQKSLKLKSSTEGNASSEEIQTADSTECNYGCGRRTSFSEEEPLPSEITELLNYLPKHLHNRTKTSSPPSNKRYRKRLILGGSNPNAI